ncbi:MAG TPA: hypothetical protein VIS96_00650 [Terrimicrobiaceae bacterium]
MKSHKTSHTVRKFACHAFPTAAGVLPARAFPARQGGPRGGRLLALNDQQAEFVVEPDRAVSSSDDALNRVPLASQMATPLQLSFGKAKLEFQPRDGLVALSSPPPEGAEYNIVLRIRQRSEVKPKNFRITCETHASDECKRPQDTRTCNH